MFTYGFRGPIYSRLKSFIINRFHCVDYNGIRSNFAKVTCGITQGYTLGPLMFLLHIKDLASAYNKCDFILFADDTTVLFHNKSVEPLITIMSYELNVIAEWFVTNRLALNNKNLYCNFSCP